MTDHFKQMQKSGREIYKATAPFRVTVPHGKSGDWSISPFKTEVNLEYARCAMQGRPPGLGTFTALRHKGHVIMSDTAAEINDLRLYLSDLKGHVLISGLGLGMVVHALTTIDKYSMNVKSITVLELDKDVIMLSADHYRKDKRVSVLLADVHKWKPTRKFDSAWHDIWPNLCEDNLKEMKDLKARYRPHVKGRQHCWGEDFLKVRAS